MANKSVYQAQDESSSVILTLEQAFDVVEDHIATETYEGVAMKDNNLPGHLLLITSRSEMLSFPESGIVRRLKIGPDITKIWVRIGTLAFRTEKFVVGGAHSEFVVGMENIAPPPPYEIEGMPAPATEGDARSIEIAVVPSLANVAANWRNSCAGGDRYDNNCAHFLSDAFIRAGYGDLATNNPNIHARCGSSAHRPVRARDMWAWFQSRATRTSRQLQRNTGWWAIFQLDERVYWGGHVVLLDSNGWKYYGTGWYGNWNQYLYQW